MVTTRLAIDRVGMISNATKKTEAPNEALFLHFIIMFLSSKILAQFVYMFCVPKMG